MTEIVAPSWQRRIALLALAILAVPSVAADVAGFTCTTTAGMAPYVTCSSGGIVANLTTYSGSATDRAANLVTSSVGRYTAVKFNLAIPASSGDPKWNEYFCDQVAAPPASTSTICNSANAKIVFGIQIPTTTHTGGSISTVGGSLCQSQAALALIAAADTTSHAIEADINWGTRVITWKVDSVVLGTRNICDTTVQYLGGTWIEATQSCAGSCSWVGTMTGLQFIGTAAVYPTAPAGVSAFVYLGYDGTHALIQIRWPLSSNDPNQTVGAYNYYVFHNGVQLPVDAITPSDGDGNRFQQVDTTNSGTEAFWVVAENATTLLRSSQSCSVSVDDTQTGTFQKCGDVQNQVVPGGVSPAVSDAGSGIYGFGASVMGTSDGAMFLYGLILAIAVFLALAGATAWAIHHGDKNRNVGPAPIIGGVVGGSGMMIFNVFAGIWNIVWAIVLIIITAAVTIYFVRRMFGAGGGGDGESG